MKPISFTYGESVENIDMISWNAYLFTLFFTHFATPQNLIDASAVVAVRRTVELTLATIIAVLISPILLMLFCLVKCCSRGPALYMQKRVGKEGTLFNIYKFRSMVVDAEKNTGVTLSWGGDPRVTRLGKFLRVSHLDELPQLFNVIMGDMSFIGPRPERPELTNKYNKDIDSYIERESVKPGITGLAQISCGYDALPSEKLDFDLLYINNRYSVFLNVLIATYTVKKMVFWKSFQQITA